MNKTQKKRDKQLRVQLTAVCQEAEEHFAGFAWLTHKVNLGGPVSLKIICVFDTDSALSHCLAHDGRAHFIGLLQAHLDNLRLSKAALSATLFFDTEEACIRHHKGNWARRLKNIE